MINLAYKTPDFTDEHFSDRLETLRLVTEAIGENATSQGEMDVARDLVELVKWLNQFDKRLQ